MLIFKSPPITEFGFNCDTFCFWYIKHSFTSSIWQWFRYPFKYVRQINPKFIWWIRPSINSCNFSRTLFHEVDTKPKLVAIGYLKFNSVCDLELASMHSVIISDTPSHDGQQCYQVSSISIKAFKSCGPDTICTDRRTAGRKDRQSDSYIPPELRSWGYNE